MALMDFLKRQLIDIIEWTDDSRDTLSYRFPDEDKEIKNGAQLIVRESQVVQFVYVGEFGDTFGPGKHTLDDRQHPDPDEPQVVEVRLRVAVQGRRLLRHHAPVHRQQVGHVESDHGARRRLRHRARARVRHLRLPDRRSEAVPEGSGRLRSQLPARRVRRHDAVAAGQRVLGRARLVEDSGARSGDAVSGDWRCAAAADQSDRAVEVRPRDRQLRARERLGAAGSGSGDRQALQHERDRQPERLREVSDGRGHGQGRRLRRRRHRARGRHGHRAADHPAAGRAWQRAGGRGRGRRGRCHWQRRAGRGRHGQPAFPS